MIVIFLFREAWLLYKTYGVPITISVIAILISVLKYWTPPPFIVPSKAPATKCEPKARLSTPRSLMVAWPLIVLPAPRPVA